MWGIRLCLNRALMERWLSFKKRFKACLKEQESCHQASDSLTACNQNSRITPLLQANP
ncbi:hypothetical protein N405_05150 [Helicobacter pylori FD568]|nr:hypothetical protein N405_05150 [Helicobacter pylori FD568]